MITIENQQKLFINIAKGLSRQITAYAIGGTAMILKGLKDSTVDIDLVFTSEKDREEFKRAAKSLGSEDMDPIVVYGKRENSPDMLKLPDARIDLFLNEVISFTFSENMRARAGELHQFDKNLFLRVADIHDLIIMKCATNRSKDEDDIMSIIKNSFVDWNTLVQEAEHQLSLGKEQAILSLGTLLERLKNEKKADVPKVILDKLWNLLKKQIERKGREK